ncbi:MAG: transglycosylase SLT domain-containing protein [Nitrosomonas sp.]|nr:transglycosylase SLT domain-containing protein [Nitrosomonas sp.]
MLSIAVSSVLLLLPYQVEAANTVQNKKSTTYSIKGRATSISRNNNVGDLWSRVRRGFSMPELHGYEVRQNENSYTRHQKFIDHIVEQSSRYLFHIVEEVERRKMPTEIALLPIIESAFNPVAYSHRHASGLWQFVPATGRAYGLEQNWWHDDRRDVIAATNAALDYLQKLHRMFGDWKLTVAAYNWGEGALKRSIEENHGGDLKVNFHDLQLPTETKNHVAKLIAIRNIIANPSQYGVKLKPLPNRPYFKQVKITQHMDVKLAAELADLPEHEFNALNPAYHRPVIRIKDKPRTLLLPVASVKTFEANLENYDKSLVSWRVYRVKENETLDDLSIKYRVDISELAEVNGLSEFDTIDERQTLLVPRKRNRNDSDERQFVAQQRIFSELYMQQPVKVSPIIHIVQKGDTLYDIAKRYSVDVKALKSWNGNKDRLAIGQKLIVKLADSSINRSITKSS